MQGQLWLSFIDNDGVLNGVNNGSMRQEEGNQIIGNLWLECVALRIALTGARVESKANLADGPAREHLEELHALGASFVAPALPAWLDNLLGFPVAQW